MKKTLTAVTAAATLALTSACGTSLGGIDLDAADTPVTGVTVAGVVVPATESGLMEPVTEPTLVVQQSDGGEIDRIAALAIEDVTDFWGATGLPGGGEFMPLDGVVSYDSTRNEAVADFCRDGIDGPNAAYCASQNRVAWDRGGLLPALRQGLGDTAILVVMAHELGHSVDRQTEQPGEQTEELRFEQRADCYSGAYMRWAAEGNSRRFAVSPDGLNRALEVVATVSDAPTHDGGHGETLERMTGFVTGFMHGSDTCADMRDQDLALQRAVLPTAADGETAWSNALADAVAASVSEVIGIPVAANGTCQTTLIAAQWCPDTRTVSVNAAGLQELSVPPMPGVIGDASGLTILTAALVQPWLEQHGKQDDLSTRICAIGAVGRELVIGDHDIKLSAGDLGEMVMASAMLTEHGVEAVRDFSEGVYAPNGLAGCIR